MEIIERVPVQNLHGYPGSFLKNPDSPIQDDSKYKVNAELYSKKHTWDPF